MDDRTLARFWSKVNKDGPIPVHRPELGKCWVWTACLGTSGYGRFGIGGRAGGTVYAHHAAWDFSFGKRDKSLWVLHRCDNPACVNPRHLFLGTHDQNMADMMNKGRSSRGKPRAYARGESNKHSRLTEENVREIRARFASGDATRRTLASEFGVSYVTIDAIVHGKTWRHVGQATPDGGGGSVSATARAASAALKR